MPTMIALVVLVVKVSAAVHQSGTCLEMRQVCLYRLRVMIAEPCCIWCRLQVPTQAAADAACCNRQQQIAGLT